MTVLNVINENILLPLSDMFFGSQIAKDLAFLNISQWYTEQQLDTYQNERLSLLLKNAYNNVPFYKDLFNQLKLKPTDIKTKDDLYKLPVLNKNLIKKEGIDRFTSKSFPKFKLIKSSSSGSTGEPLFYYNTKEAYSMNIAASLRGWYWMGFRLGDKYVKLSQNSRNNTFKQLQDKLSRNLYLATNPLIESNYELILEQIEKFKPKIIRCYPDPLLFLAKYKLGNPKFTYNPLAITTTGNTLHSETRKVIERSFNCKIFDTYSCEGNSNVFECPTHECYHSTMEYGISEVLDENNNSIKNGIGRLISTDLMNIAHPFIRYDTQDIVEVSTQPCSCGRKLFRINRIIGRDNDILETTSGRKFIVHNFTGFFQIDSSIIKRSVDQFQVIKMANSNIKIKLKVNEKYNEDVRNYIQNFWEKELETQVIIEEVISIPLTASGKRKFIINENL
jgi:phenylacetate-CoA ligase